MDAGQIIDQRYEVVRLLGAGAMASVYEVRHISLHSHHAIKILNLDLAQDATLRSRFLSEGRIQAQLRHPNIVSVSDIVTSPAPGLVMELVSGGTIADYLEQQGAITDVQTVLALFLPILSAVEAAHQAGIVHRDLKPENIMMGTGPRGELRPMVADFGIARILDSTQIEGSKRRTEEGQRLGTVLYMSPEQVRGLAVDIRSDIFALGAILYEILTNQIAFDAPSQYGTMKRIVEGSLPTRVIGDLPVGFAACIRKALATAPEERFQSCTDFQDALVQAVQPGGPLPTRPSRSQTITVVPPDPLLEPPPLPVQEPPPLPTQEPPPLPSQPPPPSPEVHAPRPTSVPFDPGGVVRTGPPAMPWTTALINCTMLLTGVGQMMNGQVWKGIVVLLAHWTLALFTCFVSVPVTAFIAAIDSWLIAQKLQQGRHVSSWELF